MAERGKTVDNPVRVNLTNPSSMITIETLGGPMVVDLREVARAADAMGIEKYDTFSIPGYRNARGTLVPMYDSITFERKCF